MIPSHANMSGEKEWVIIEILLFESNSMTTHYYPTIPNRSKSKLSLK